MDLRTSAVRHPSNSPFIIRRFYQVEACELESDNLRESTPEVAAELLGIFEYHTNNSYKNSILNSLIKHARRKYGKDLVDTNGWLPYSISYLRELLGYSRGKVQIEKGIDRLALKTFLLTDCPNEIVSCYSKNMKWFKLNVEALNALADLVENGEDLRESNEVKEPERLSKRKTIASYVSDVANFHKHINEISNYIYDAKRLRMVKARFQERKAIFGEEKAFAQMILAVISNSLDDFYQGRSEKNTEKRVLNKLEYIFREGRILEIHLDNADKLQVNEEIALREFEAFLSGKTSRYALKAGKEAERQAEALKKHRPSVFQGDIPKYRGFARKVVSFFTDGKTADMVLETLMLDDELHSFGKELTDGAYLAQSITESAKMFEETISDKLQAEINKFALEYAENNSANTED